MDEKKQPEPVKTLFSMRRLLTYAALLVVAFLIGLVPMWLKSRECASSLSQVEHDLNIARIENALSTAVIDARRGEYEQARQAASDFFTSLGVETETATDTAFSQTRRERLQSILALRDDVITRLARSEPESADRLTDLYVSFQKIMKYSEGELDAEFE